MATQTDIRLSVDAILFGYTPEKDLHVLLIRRNIEPFLGKWALPGGFVRQGESLDKAVRRELHEEAGIEPDYLEQLYTFGDPGRDPRAQVVSVAYFGLVKPSKFTLNAGTDASDAAWWPLSDLPELAFDHREIVQTALRRLRSKATYEPIGFDLLDDKFPFSHLEHLYATLLGFPLERRNFRRKIMQYGFLEELPEKATLPGSGRPGALFRFRKDRYFELIQQGIFFEVTGDQHRNGA
jgi:8-oxo-dGTP diphosphatase